MKTAVLTLAAMAVAAGAFASTYYVDAENGDDAWDGSCDQHVAETTQGPMKTLAAVMSVVKSGDVVYALPGVYSNGTMTASGLNRVVVKSYVTLQSTEGPEKTIIMGESDPDFPLYDGCGTNSVRGAYVNNYARLSGFTITGGHAQYKSTATYEQGGGVMATSCSLTPAKIGVIDNCVISNNVAYQSGGCRFGGYVGCRIVDNRSTGQGYSCITGAREGFLYDCYLRGSGWAADFSYAYNTTFDCTIHGKWGSNMCKNCVILGGILNYMGSADVAGCSNCVLVSSLQNGHQQYCDAATRFMTREEMMVDADGRPQKGSPLINAAVEAYHDTAPFPSALGGVSAIDAMGLSRISGGMMDVGGYEYDWRGDFSETLDPLGCVNVTNASCRVALTDADRVHLATNTTLALVWRPYSGTEANYRFHAQVTGTGMLKIMKDGALWSSLTADDGDVWFSVQKSGTLGLSFAYAAGDNDAGGAEIWDFTNIAYANITVADGGVALTGASVGLNYVPAGGSLTFSAQRVFDRADKVCTGVTSNGVFYAFDDHPNGLSFTVADATRENLALEAVYETITTVWYVDAVNGSDSNFGHHRLNAFETLAGAMSHVAKDHVVYALPGVYSNGTMTTTETIGGESVSVLNRVVIPAGVQLISTDGPDATIIRGEEDPTNPLWNGCGTMSVRCVVMRAGWSGNGSRLVGFTVRNGHAYYASASAYASGGGFNNSGREAAYMDCACVENCIISNNVAYSNGAGGAGAYIGCRIVDNHAYFCGGVAGWNELFLYDCFVKGNTATSRDYQIYSPRFVYNSTIVGVSYFQGSDVWNSAIVGSISYTANAYHNCIISSENQSSQSMCCDADCHFFSAAEIDLDADGMPSMDSPVVDAGSNTYHVVTAGKYPTRTETATDFWTDGMSKTDAVLSQRIYNARIDIGGCEYDWRGVYTDDISPRRAVVTKASESVVEADGKVRMTDGTSLTLVVNRRKNLATLFTASISGAGTLTVKRGETILATLTAESPTLRFRPISEAEELVLSYAGDGFAEPLSVKGGEGLMILLR